MNANYNNINNTGVKGKVKGLVGIEEKARGEGRKIKGQFRSPGATGLLRYS